MHLLKNFDKGNEIKCEFSLIYLIGEQFHFVDLLKLRFKMYSKTSLAVIGFKINQFNCNF